MAENYLKTKVLDIIEPMVNALLIATPEDPNFFMIEWLQKFNKVDGVYIDEEREELENLRMEMKKYNELLKKQSILQTEEDKKEKEEEDKDKEKEDNKESDKEKNKDKGKNNFIGDSNKKKKL